MCRYRTDMSSRKAAVASEIRSSSSVDWHGRSNSSIEAARTLQTSLYALLGVDISTRVRSYKRFEYGSSSKRVVAPCSACRTKYKYFTFCQGPVLVRTVLQLVAGSLEGVMLGELGDHTDCHRDHFSVQGRWSFKVMRNHSTHTTLGVGHAEFG